MKKKSKHDQLGPSNTVNFCYQRTQNRTNNRWQKVFATYETTKMIVPTACKES